MLLLATIGRVAVESLLAQHGLQLVLVAPGEAIPGSYWGEPEAGLVRSNLYARADTPLHSILHESGHYLCMTPQRRAALHTDAGGDDGEEGAVCYLQILLGGMLTGVGRARLCTDMDAWGYSFRLGSTAAWFADDADDARRWLMNHALIDEHDRVLHVR